MRLSRTAFGVVGAAVCTLFLVPAHSSAQDSLAVGCAQDSPPFALLLRCAERGDANSQFLLGGRYFNGDGVPQDAAEAVRWYRLAAAQGLALAQYNL